MADKGVRELSYSEAVAVLKKADAGLADAAKKGEPKTLRAAAEAFAAAARHARSAKARETRNEDPLSK